MNPYGQAGWSQAGQGQSNPWGSGIPPSIFGALPSLQPTSSVPRCIQSDSVTYQFTSFNTTILNCTVLNKSNSQVTYRIVTEPSAPSCTVFKDNASRNVAMVEWQPNTTLEIRNVAPKQRLRDWLRLSSDKSRRYMVVNGVQYAWAPMDNFICLYKAQSTAPRVLARIARAPTTVFLEILPEALNLGLLEPSLVATAIFVSGHNID